MPLPLSKNWISTIVDRPSAKSKAVLPVAFHDWAVDANGELESTGGVGVAAFHCRKCPAVCMRGDVLAQGLMLWPTNLDIIWRLRHPTLRTKCG